MDPGASQSDTRTVLQMRKLIKYARDEKVCSFIRKCLNLGCVSYHKLTGATTKNFSANEGTPKTSWGSSGLNT